MLGKILLTLAVIVTAFVYIRSQNSTAKGSAKSLANKAKAAGDTLSADMRLAAYMFLTLTLGLGAALYYFDWQDDHTIMAVTLHRDQAEAVIYEVYKYQLDNRSFVTINGVTVNVAGSERMEVRELTQ